MFFDFFGYVYLKALTVKVLYCSAKNVTAVIWSEPGPVNLNNIFIEDISHNEGYTYYS